MNYTEMTKEELVAELLKQKEEFDSMKLAYQEDIIKLKSNDEQLILSESTYKGILDSISEAVYIEDENGLFLDVNLAAEKMYGYKKEEFIGRSPEFLSAPGMNDLSKLGEYMQKAFEGEPQTFEFWGIAKDGRVFPKDVSNSIGFYFGKRVIIAVARDVSDRKKAEKALLESNDMFKFISENTSDGILVFDKNNKITFSSHAADKLMSTEFGKSLELTPEEIFTLIHPDDAPKIFSQIFEAQKNKVDELTYSYRVKNNLGELIWREDNSKFKYDENGNISHTIVVGRNITERKRIEEELIRAKEHAEESEEKYKQIFDNTADNIFIFEVTDDQRYKVIDFNKSEEELVGKLENYKDKYIEDTFKPDIYNLVKKNYDKCLFARKSIQYEEEIRGKTFFTQLIPVMNSEGRVHRMIGIARNISEVRELTTNLINQNEKLTTLNSEISIAREKAVESDKLKTAFLQNMSHEIRTPLNGIIGFSSLLNNPKITAEDIQDYTTVIQQSGDRLLEIVNNVLDISKIETGQMQINFNHFSINSLFTDVYSLFAPLASKKKLQLVYQGNMEDNIIVYSDETKLHQVFNNILNNAIKFTKSGLIEYGYHVEDDFVLFYVKDTGIGIDEVFYDKVFERFAQADLSISRGFEGAGIGLAICKGIIKALGGKIWFTSELGVGTTFFFNVPLKQSIENNTKITKNKSLEIMKENTKILIAEDDYTSYLYIKNFLKNSNYELIWAENGKLAVEFVKRMPDIDLILMDIKMPIMDGFEATRQIKKIRPDVPIIAQTAYAFSDERNQILAIGCDDYISKPIQSLKLLEIIEKYLN